MEIRPEDGIIKLKLEVHLREERDKELSQIGDTIDGITFSELFGAQNDIVVIKGVENEAKLKKLAKSFHAALMDAITQDGRQWWLLTDLEIEMKRVRRENAERVEAVHSLGSGDPNDRRI